MDLLQAIFPAHDCALLAAIIFLPLLGAFVNGVFGSRLGKDAVTLMGLATVGASFIGSCAAFSMLRVLQTGEGPARLLWDGWQWIGLSTPGEVDALSHGAAVPLLKIDVAFSMDALSATMALIVTGIGFLIHLYSTKYMDEDASYHRFFAYLNLFIFSMMVLILGDSLPILFIGWEGVGLCSYLLIGFWFSESANAAAGKKAFITNRIGDFGLLVAMALLLRYTGSLSWTGVAGGARELLHPVTIWQIPWLAGKSGFWGALGAPVQVSAASLVGFSLFLGCAGKSAQIPLYVWLPDAMAGPTPVSALIHAATMVTAGVYLVCRMAPVFVLSPAVMFTVACIGAATAVLAASIALVQNDIKKVLAYSTVSQLGYMFMGVGVGAFTAGFFHVITHAFFKACLFLGAGSVIHAMHARVHGHDASQDIRNMGGLWKHLPITHWTFLASCLAIAGFPGTSGYFSKDEILHSVFMSSVKPPTADGMIESMHSFVWPTWGGQVLLAAGILGAVMTAFYMFRLYILVFLGEFRGWKIVEGAVDPGHDAHDHGHDGHAHDAHDAHDHDAHGHHPHEGLLEGPAPLESPWQMYLPLVVLGTLAIVGGFAFMHPLELWLEPVFAVARNAVVATDQGGFVQALAAGAGITGLLGAVYVYYSQRGAPAKQLAEGSPRLYQLVLDKWRVDEFYDEFFIETLVLIADVCVWIDKWVVDGIIARFTSWVVAVTGHLLRMVQTGRVQAYAAVMVVGTACLGWFFTMPQAVAHVESDAASGHYTVTAAPGLDYGYRWDADADGKPDAPEFSDQKSVELTLRIGETRNVRLEVKNAFGRVGARTFKLTRPAPDESGATAARDSTDPAGVVALGQEALR